MGARAGLAHTVLVAMRLPAVFRPQLLLRRSHQQDLQHPEGLWILSIALLTQRTLGLLIRRSGAAASTMWVARNRSSCRNLWSCQRLSCQPGRPILTIAPMVSQIGWQAGLWRRRSGAAGSMGRVARIRVA